MKERTTRCFSDVWQLRLEMPGGAMTEEDRQIDVRTETMGPWRRCYTCGDVGFDYKKCSGTCGGRYFFCSVTCQRTGWSEHKQAQGCRIHTRHRGTLYTRLTRHPRRRACFSTPTPSRCCALGALRPGATSSFRHTPATWIVGCVISKSYSLRGSGCRQRTISTMSSAPTQRSDPLKVGSLFGCRCVLERLHAIMGCETGVSDVFEQLICPVAGLRPELFDSTSATNERDILSSMWAT